MLYKQLSIVLLGFTAFVLCLATILPPLSPPVAYAKPITVVSKPKVMPHKKITEKEPKKVLSQACGGDKQCTCVMDKVFKHDSSWATAGVGKKANNPCNMRIPVSWKPSVKISKHHSANGIFAKFATLSDGITGCVETYQHNYADVSPSTLVRRWTNGGGNAAYRSDVSACYL